MTWTNNAGKAGSATFCFDRQVVAVTGAAHGIGRAIASHFVQAGARVLLLDQDAQAVEAAASALAAAGGRASAEVVDVTDAEALLALAERTAEQEGRLDVLVNSAGVLLRGALDDDDALRKWRQTMDVNLGGTFHAIHAFAPLVRACRGNIVNISSIHSLVAVKNSAAYTAAKGGIKQLTQALALELGPDGVRVNAVAPGSTDTDMNSAMRRDPQVLAAFVQRIPLGRTAQVDDIAHAVLFLASDLASYISGVTLPVDGGYCAN